MASLPFAVVAPRSGHRAFRRGGVALRINLRVLGMVIGAAVALALLMLWAMTLGDYPIGFADVVRATVGRGDADQVLIVRDVRLPRVLCAALVGAALAVSGAIFQGVVRNPLVSPDIIGIDSGAGVCAVCWIVVGLAPAALPLAAFAGAVGAAAVVYGLAWRRGIAPTRLVLIGIGVGALLDAGTTWLTVRFPVERVRPALVWLFGSLSGSDWADVRAVALAVGLAVPLGIAFAWPMRAIQLGDDVARGLGLPLEPTRLALLGIGCALAAAAVAVAGPILFVALMIPHLGRMIAGPLSGTVLLFTGFLGALFVLLADVVAQHALPVSLPVGVVSAAMGAPYFLVLLARVNARL